MGNDIILDKFGEDFVKKFEEKEYSLIVKEVEKLLLEHPESTFGWSLLGNSHFELKDFQKAIESFEQEASRGVIDSHLPYYNLGRSYDGLNNFEKAEENYKKSLAIKPDDYSSNYLLSNVYVKIGLYEKAEKFIKKSYEINPNALDLIVNLLSALYFNKKFEEAVKIAESAIKQHTTNYELFYNLSLCYYEIKEYQKGVEVINKSLSLMSSDSDGYADALVAKGAHLMRLVRNDEAIETLMEALKINNDHLGAFKNLSDCYNHISDHRASVLFNRLAYGVIEFEEKTNDIDLSLIRIEKVPLKQ